MCAQYGSRFIGLCVAICIEEDLLVIVVSSEYFAADLEQDISKWSVLAHKTPIGLKPASQAAYIAGGTGRKTRCCYDLPIMLPLRHEMINAFSKRHWRAATMVDMCSTGSARCRPMSITTGQHSTTSIIHSASSTRTKAMSWCVRMSHFPIACRSHD